MKPFYTGFLFVWMSANLCAQSVSTLMGARANGIGYASAALFDSWAIFNNVAGLVKTTQPTASFAYDARTALPGANRTAAVFAVPVKVGVAGGGIFRFGDNLYSESILTGGFSNQLGLAALGVRVNYIQYRAEGFGTQGILTFNFGGIAELTPKLSVGAHITNINQPKLSVDDDRVPTILAAGISFTPTEKVFLATEIEKDLDHRATWKMGIEYLFHKKFCARTGYNVQPNAAFFGVGFKTSKFNLDYALQNSVLLQFSHQASVQYQFSK